MEKHFIENQIDYEQYLHVLTDLLQNENKLIDTYTQIINNILVCIVNSA